MTDATKPDDHVFLVDGSSHMFRSFFQAQNQDPRYNFRSDGLPTGAVRLFMTKLLQLSREGAAGIRASHLMVAFDKGSDKNPRKRLMPDYKANRATMPDDLKAQAPLVRAAVRSMGVEPVESDGIEADDLIAAYAKAALAEGRKVLVISSDKDLMQLVGPDVRFYDSESGTKGKPGYRPERNLDADGVAEKWEGAGPGMVGDVLALVGDSSDNIPGVPGIGVKTAVQLLKEHGSLEAVLAAAPGMKQAKRRENLVESTEQVRLNRRIVALDDAVDMPVPLADLAFPAPDGRRIVAFLKALELTAAVKRVGQAYGVDVDSVPPDPAYARTDAAVPVDADDPDPRAGERAAARSAAAAVRAMPFDARYDLVADEARLAGWMQGARANGSVAVTLECDPEDGGVIGIGLALKPGLGGYVPLGHGEPQSLFGGGLAPGQVPEARAMEIFRPVLEEAGIRKVFHDAKTAFRILARHGIRPRGYDDVELASCALDSGLGPHDLDSLADRHLGAVSRTLSEALGRRKVDLRSAAPAEVAPWAGRGADTVMRLWTALSPRIDAEGMRGVYGGIDLPLAPVVADMEARGIKVDRKALQGLSVQFGRQAVDLEEEAYELAGERFNIASPKAVGEVMFGRLGLPGGKKTASGQWGTTAVVLDELAEAGHPFPSKVKAWREVTRLKSVYTDGLQAVAEPGTDTVHTNFNLAATVTGRLSSNEPNLQNIPVRTEEGRRIRKAFVAAAGHRLLAADYSQIELRILAHIAEIPQLRQAFEDGVDIHAATASEMFGVPLEGMDPGLRRSAKTINFGIIYGVSAYGLSSRLGVSQSEAAAFIKAYFERFPGIRDYIEDTKERCRADGFVTTLFGRVCHYPAIRSPNGSERQGVERQAINAPIQGSAADIIRRAMARMEAELTRAGLGARMLLQVHDELVFDVPEAEVEATIPVVREVMEGAAAPDVNFSVPLVVDAKAGLDWLEAH